jgi:hypothetical protein
VPRSIRRARQQSPSHRRVSAVRSGIRTWRRGYRFGDTFGGLALGPAGSTLRDVLGRFWADGEPERVEF